MSICHVRNFAHAIPADVTSKRQSSRHSDNPATMAWSTRLHTFCSQFDFTSFLPLAIPLIYSTPSRIVQNQFWRLQIVQTIEWSSQIWGSQNQLYAIIRHYLFSHSVYYYTAADTNEQPSDSRNNCKADGCRRKAGEYQPVRLFCPVVLCSESSSMEWFKAHPVLTEWALNRRNQNPDCRMVGELPDVLSS